MSAEEAQEPRITKTGICVKCRRHLPSSAFPRDAAGQDTAWCIACRNEVARKWGCDPSEVEILYALYLLERSLKEEAEVVLKCQIAKGQEPAYAMDQLHARIQNHDRVATTRIPRRLKAILDAYREEWYAAIGVVPRPAWPLPDLPEPAKAEASR